MLALGACLFFVSLHNHLALLVMGPDYSDRTRSITWLLMTTPLCGKTLLALREGNTPVTGGFASQRASNMEFRVLGFASLNKVLTVQSICWWFYKIRRPVDASLMWCPGPDSRNDPLAMGSDTILWSWSADLIPQKPITIGSWDKKNAKPTRFSTIETRYKSLTEKSCDSVISQ